LTLGSNARLPQGSRRDGSSQRQERMNRSKHLFRADVDAILFERARMLLLGGEASGELS